MNELSSNHDHWRSVKILALSGIATETLKAFAYTLELCYYLYQDDYNFWWHSDRFLQNLFGSIWAEIGQLMSIFDQLRLKDFS